MCGECVLALQAAAQDLDGGGLVVSGAQAVQARSRAARAWLGRAVCGAAAKRCRSGARAAAKGRRRSGGGVRARGAGWQFRGEEEEQE